MDIILFHPNISVPTPCFGIMGWYDAEPIYFLTNKNFIPFQYCKITKQYHGNFISFNIPQGFISFHLISYHFTSPTTSYFITF